MARGDSPSTGEREALLARYAETGDPALLDQLVALDAPGGPSVEAPAERLTDVLDRLREQTDPGRREAPPAPEASPAQGGPWPGWGLVAGLVAAVALVVVGLQAPPAGPPDAAQLRGDAAAEAWPDQAQAALRACCAADQPVRARLHVGPDGAVVQVELLGAEDRQGAALQALQALPPAPNDRRSGTLDVWIR